jgi:hypothetical protein
VASATDVLTRADGDGRYATPASVTAAVNATGARTVTGATTVVVNTDVTIIHDAATGHNITLPTSTVLGWSVRLIQKGVGIPTFVAGTSATLIGSPASPTAQNKSVVATLIANDTWMTE